MLDLPQPVPAERRYQSQWLDPARPHSLLELDPDLGRRLAPDRARGAARELCVRAAMLGRGAWRPERFRHGAATVGLLVVDGAIVREISVHDAPSAELFG